MAGSWDSCGLRLQRTGSASTDGSRAASPPATCRRPVTATSHSSSNSTSALFRSMTKARRRSGGAESPAERMMTTEEYQALPSQIRKKYFSTSERLRITTQNDRPSSSHSNSRKVTPEPSHISTLPDNWKPGVDHKTKPSMTSSLLRSRRRHSRSNIEQQSTVTEDQAAWFLSLPDKVKRQHFSKEERELLVERCATVLGKGSPKLSQESAQEFCQRKLNTLPETKPKFKSHRRSSAPATTHLDDQTLADIAAADAPQAIDDEEEDDMGILNLQARRHSVGTTRETAPPPPCVHPAQMRSFRRSFALRPLPLPAPILAPCPSPGFFNGSETLQRPAKLRRRPTEQCITPPELSPKAKHYQDPEMRNTLRAMSSPELFDEALEYGFPPPPTRPPPARPTRSAKIPSRHGGNGTDHDRSSSLTSSSTADTNDLITGPGPSTPDGPSNFPEPAFASSDMPSELGLPPPSPPLLHRRANTTGHSRTPSFANREMTIRMTLTRPILRATDTDLDATIKSPLLPAPTIEQNDPLALASIPICDDATGAQGAFAVPESSQNLKGIKKALRQLVGK